MIEPIYGCNHCGHEGKALNRHALVHDIQLHLSSVHHWWTSPLDIELNTAKWGIRVAPADIFRR